MHTHRHTTHADTHTHCCVLKTLFSWYHAPFFNLSTLNSLNPVGRGFGEDIPLRTECSRVFHPLYIVQLY